MTTIEDRAIWTSLTGFTDHDIEIIARAVGVDEPTVYRMVDCIRFVKSQGLSEQRLRRALEHILEIGTDCRFTSPDHHCPEERAYDDWCVACVARAALGASA